MGFFDGLLGKKEAEVKIEKIEFSELPAWVANRKQELGGGLDEKTSEVLSRLPDALQKIRDRLDELDGAEMGRDVQQRIQSIVSSSRDNYVSKVRKLIDEIDLSSEPLKLSDKLGEVLAEVQKVDLKYGQRANFGFSERLSKVKKELNGVIEISNSLNQLLEERKSKLKKLKAVESGLKKVDDELDELKKLEERKNAKVDEVRTAKLEKRKDLEGIDKIEHSERAERLEALEEELGGLKSKRQEQETLVLNMLGPLRRVFKKYARAIKEGKASGINVDKYAEDPAGTYLWGEHTLPELLAKIQKAIQTRLLDLDQAESERALKKIRGISFTYLEKTRSEYNRVTSRIRSVELQMKELSIDREVEKLQREVDSLEDKIESANKKAVKLEEDIETQRAKVTARTQELNQKLSDFIGGKCELVSAP